MSRTLRIAQYWVRIAGQYLDDKIASLLKFYPLEPDLVRQLPELDPTKDRGSYLPWIMRGLSRGDFHLPSDRDRVRDALKGYSLLKAKPSAMKKQGVNRNVMEYNLADLEKINQRFYGSEGLLLKKERGEFGFLIYARDNIRIFRAGGPGMTLEEAEEFVVTFAEGTEWCTGSCETARSHLQDGPLYLILRGNTKFGQFQEKTGQLKDVEDRDIPLDLYPDVATALWNSGIPDLGKNFYPIIDMAKESIEFRATLADSPLREREAISNRNIIADYSLLFKEGRWVEGEDVLLNITSVYQVRPAFYYAKNVLGKRWPELEIIVLKLLVSLPVEGDDQFDFDSLVGAITLYCKSMRFRWVDFENVVIQKLKRQQVTISQPILEYSNQVCQGGWVELNLILGKM